MIFSRKVDKMNKKPGGKSPGEGKEEVVVVTPPESWWSKFYKNDKKRVWLIVLATVTIIIANIFLPKEAVEKTIENPYFWASVVALFGVHIIWGIFAPSKGTSLVEMTILYGIIFFYGLTLVFPNDIVTIRDSWWGITKKVVADAASNSKSANENYDKVEVSQSVEQTAVAQAVVTSVQLTIPVDETVFVTPPQGYRLSSALCPPENVMEITGSHEEVLQQIDCAGKITLEEAELYGRKFAFFQKKGSTQPSVVVVRWVKIV